MTSETRDARFWNRIARRYARNKIADMAGYERTLERTRELLNSADEVLELGCGTGTTALRLAPNILRITGTDISSEMIRIARDKATAQACHNAKFEVSPAGAVGLPDAAFDAVLAFNLLHLVPDRASTLAEVRRLLKPGGRFISKTPCLSEMNPMIRLAVPVMRLIRLAPSVTFFNAAELEADIAGAGFEIIERARHGSGRKDARIFIVAKT